MSKGYDFLGDEPKMHDFLTIGKEDFLESYSYLTEEDYEATYKAVMDILEEKCGWWTTIKEEFGYDFREDE